MFVLFDSWYTVLYREADCKVISPHSFQTQLDKLTSLTHPTLYSDVIEFGDFVVFWIIVHYSRPVFRLPALWIAGAQRNAIDPVNCNASARCWLSVARYEITYTGSTFSWCCCSIMSAQISATLIDGIAGCLAATLAQWSLNRLWIRWESTRVSSLTSDNWNSSALSISYAYTYECDSSKTIASQ